MSTTGKTAGELAVLLTEELGKDDKCCHIQVGEVFALPNADLDDLDDCPNWSARCYELEEAVSPEGKRGFIAAIVKLQRRYHLLTDA